MQQYEDLGHMREVDEHLPSTNPTYYLPHHAICKNAGTASKFRVVFDGSSKTSTGVSLNDVLMVGPTIQDDLFLILARFRTFRIAITSDIAKMYRQVLIDPSQTALQRILWRSSTEEPIKTLELLTVTYGTSSAPFLAIRSMRKLAEDNLCTYPVGSKAVLNDFYVDDMVTGADTLDEALTLKKETIELLRKGKFELRKWASNEPTLRNNQSTSDQQKFLPAEREGETRILSIAWNSVVDDFRFTSAANLPLLQTPTKRSILSRIALIFDPLGLLGPTTVVVKIIMQNLWRLKINWDESLSLDLTTKWRQFETELSELQSITIPRRVIAIDQYDKLEMHGFADASEAAYGACIYMRALSTDMGHVTRLLCSKSRIAPLKSLSLPRLELCAAVLLTRLMDKISRSLTCKVDSIYLWTDSTIVLSWIQECSRVWNSFVANRVGEIHQLTDIHDWHHIRSNDNPADPLSRGVMPASLSQLKIWWAGPTWLALNEVEWPPSTFTSYGQDIPERKSKHAVMLTTVTQEFDLFHRYSDFSKLLRIVAYIFRFFDQAKRSIQSSKDSKNKRDNHSIAPITVNERQRVIKCLVKTIQLTYFDKELQSISNHGTVDKSSPIIKLSPFKDESGILRVGGRLRASSLPYSAKHPMLLPGKHPFSLLIIRHEHERHFHAGPQATLAAVRQNYWIISAGSITRQVTRKCITCFRSSPKTPSTIMGNLSKDRVNVPGRPFETCGVDYVGPLYYKEGTRKNSRSTKCYLAVFVCFVTKAIHLELASNMSTEAFLNVLKRFVARRGCPSDIHSDNGLNFVGAERELDELITLLKNETSCRSIIHHTFGQGIQWHFIPPRVLQHGGLWEAAVKSAKRHLLRMTKEAHLRHEELQTLITQIEGILNSRPLTPLSSDPGDLTPLTPGHFLIGGPITSYPEPDLRDVAENRLSRWQYVERLRQEFWRRWVHEYLHQHQQRNKWTLLESIHDGQMVILKEDNVPPLLWPMGRIVKVHPSQDGINRVASVRTTKGIYKRPITRLCLLPVESKS